MANRLQANWIQGSAWAMVLVAAFAFVAGCGASGGPELTDVKGKVTLDGQALPNATVDFTPTGARGSGAVTDQNGEYRLEYTPGTYGVVLGEHKVAISTAREPKELGEAATPEKLPAKYNKKTELKAKVEKGQNTHNFDLKSK